MEKQIVMTFSITDPDLDGEDIFEQVQMLMYEEFHDRADVFYGPPDELVDGDELAEEEIKKLLERREATEGGGHKFPADSRFTISMMPADLRNEVAEILALNPDHEEASWWGGASEEEYERLAYSMMSDEYLWDVWRECLYDSMHEEMRECQKRREAAEGEPAPKD